MVNEYITIRTIKYLSTLYKHWSFNILSTEDQYYFVAIVLNNDEQNLSILTKFG